MTKSRKAMTDGERVATHQLDDLTLQFGSVVDKGDCPEAHVVHTKGKPIAGVAAETEPEGLLARAWKWARGVNKDAGGYSPPMPSEILRSQDVAEEYGEIQAAFMQCFNSIMCMPPAEQGDLLRAAVADFDAQMGPVLDMMSAAKRAQVGAAIGELVAASKSDDGRAAFVVAIEKLDTISLGDDAADAAPPGQKAEEAMSAPKKTLAEILKTLGADDRAVVIDDMKATVAAEVKAQADAAAQAAKDAAKGADDAVTKRLDAMEKAQKASDERAAKAEAEVAKLRVEKDDVAFVAKAAALGLRGADSDDVVATLKAAYAVSPESGARTEKMLRGLAAQSAKNDRLTRAVGSAGGAAKSAMDADAQLDAKAKALMGTDAKLTYAKAYKLAMRQDPHLGARAVSGEDD